MFSLFKVKLSKPFYVSASAAVFKLSCVEPAWSVPEGHTSCFSLGSSGLLDPVSVCVCVCAHVCACVDFEWTFICKKAFCVKQA